MTTATARASFEQLAKLESGQERDDRLAVAKSPPDVDGAERLSQNVALNAQLRTTCVATLIVAGKRLPRSQGYHPVSHDPGD